MVNKCNEIYSKLGKAIEVLNDHSENNVENQKIKISFDKSELILLKVAIATYDKFTSTVIDEMCKGK